LPDGGTNGFGDSFKNLTISAAYNNSSPQNGRGQLSGASTKTVEGYATGLKYKATPAIEVGTFYAHGRTNGGTSVTAATTGQNSAATGVGVGYQATPAILLGANYIKTTFGASMTNLQAHYMLSKRTRVYTQASFNQGATGNNQLGGTLANSFSAFHCNSSSEKVQTVSSAGAVTSTDTRCADGISSSGGSTSKANNNGYVAGVIHTF
jgi:predicted porin